MSRFIAGLRRDRFREEEGKARTSPATGSNPCRYASRARAVRAPAPCPAATPDRVPSPAGTERSPRGPAAQNATFTPIMNTSERAELSLWVWPGTTSPRSSLTLPPLRKFKGIKPST